MLTKSGLMQLADIRLEDAILLLRNNRASAAYYLAGYAVELAIKACIAKLLRPDTIPDRAFVNAIYTHDLSQLLRTAGLQPAFEEATKANPVLASYWAIVNNWSPESRYEVWDPVAAATLITAVCDPQNGVLQWLKARW